jgi:hypothetical protein
MTPLRRYPARSGSPAHTLGCVFEVDPSFASREPDGDERFQRLRRQLGVGAEGELTVSVEHQEQEGGEGRAPAEVPLPEDLLERHGP